MAGHYLETINPAAVDQIGGVAARLPGIGAMVVYHARPGEGRSGKSAFPALVLHHEPDGHSLYLLVMYAVDDFVERPQIRQLSEEQQHFYPAWDHVQGAAPEKFEPSRLNHMREDLEKLRVALDETKSGIYGGWMAPAGSLMDYLIKFEQKLDDMSRRLSAMEGSA